jgi:hypothetical protein
MRFMMLMIPAVYQPKSDGRPQVDEGFAPTLDDVSAMMKFNEELAKAGVLVSLDGLHPLSKGARVSYAGGKPAVTDGPYAEVKEVLGGYWVINVGSKEEAVEWARKIPADEGDIVEVRQIFEMSDFPEDVQRAADCSTVSEALETANS